MDSENRKQVRFDMESNHGGDGSSCLRKFMLYETRSNFYMIGRDKNITCIKVLKINRLESSELSIIEDSTIYSQVECDDLLNRIHEGNKSTGGLKFLTTCYGIIGFIKFLGPYYMLLITKRRKMGTICGHAVYSVAKTEMIPVSNLSLQSNMTYSKDENRYKKLLRIMDLTKDFFFSYSYRVMLSLQKNLSNHDTGLHLYETMFVWNEFLTRGLNNQLKSSGWTVALVYGFFKQDKFSFNGRDFNLVLIARRSRHYAGTRYLKRGVNEKGRVANDVETEQIVFEDVAEGCPKKISSVVQNRGSIPLFWSQETSRLNIKPDIICSKKDLEYKATKLHFENLTKRYGNPVIILNLIKTCEKKPRESILHAEFVNAIEVINKDIAKETQAINSFSRLESVKEVYGNNDHLKYFHCDLNKYFRIEGANVLAYLVKVAAKILYSTGFFYCQLPASSRKLSCSRNNCNDDYYNHGGLCDKPMVFQKGVLRTNCIDCLDRTNVAQYAYGLVSLGHQLHALGYIDNHTINLDSNLAHDLMRTYEAMGDILALQYGGSAAHNKIFQEIRGEWKAATQSQEFFRSLQRYYSNVYMDAEKQNAINLFLGHFLPQQGKPALWELDSDQNFTFRHRSFISLAERARLIFQRSLSDGSIVSKNNLDIETEIEQMDNIDDNPLSTKIQSCNIGPLQETPQISTCVSDMSYSRHIRYTPLMFRKQIFPYVQSEKFLRNESTCANERGYPCSNFIDVDRLFSYGTCEEDTYERSLLIVSSNTGVPSGYESGLGKEPAIEISERFLHWVIGDSFFF